MALFRFGKEFVKSTESCRNSKFSEKRRMQFLRLFRTEHDSNNTSTFVPHPIIYTASQKTISSQKEALNSKMGIYKSCNGKILSVIDYSVNNVSIRSLQFSNDSKLLILGLSTGDLQGIKVSDNSLHKEFTRNENEKNCPVTCIKFNPNPAYHDLFYRGSSTGNIAMFCVNDEKRHEELHTGKFNQINSLDIDKTGKNLVSGGKDAIIRIHSTETHQLVTEYRRKDYNDNPEEKNAGFHRLRVFVVRFHPEEANLFVSGGWDNLVKIWDVRTPSGCVNTIIGTHISGHSVDLKKNMLLTGSFEPNAGLQLWDFRTTKHIMNCNPINVIRQLEGLFINNAQFFCGDPLGDIILSSNVAIKSLDVISLKKKMLLHTFNSSQPVSAVHCYENKIAFGDMGQQLFICEFYVAGTINDNIEKNSNTF